MCGIFGYVGARDIPIESATDLIDYRGPDAEGFLQWSLHNGQLRRGRGNHWENGVQRVAFGFRRLAIIDLDSRSNQPFSHPSGKFHLVFNGEIYNYLEVREELVRRNHQFATESDTEVLLKAYVEWGPDCLARLNGMWAFAILDVERRRLFCSRDRFGIKPFYYYASDDEFFFASEIKQLFAAGVDKEVNTNVIRDFLDQRILDHTNETFFKNIHQLPAGSYISVPCHSPGELQPQRFWRLQVQPEHESLSYGQAKDRFRELFDDSVKLRFRSDVPVGACLSGGLDSSAVVAVASELFSFPIHTFTSQFDISAFDETEYAQLLPQKFDNLQPHFCSPTEATFREEFDKILFHLDEPFASMTNVARWEIMKLVKSQGVTVVLNGQGADELLAGYRKFFAFYLKEKIQQGQLCRFASELFHLVKNREFNFFELKEIRRYLKRANLGSFYTPDGHNLPAMADIGLRGADTMKQRCLSDVERYSYPILLRYEDRLSMAFSLETRVPFLDYRLIEFLFSIPADYKIRSGYTKAILRDSLAGTLPAKIQRRVSKLGFSTPEVIWTGTTLKKYFLDYFQQLRNPWIDGARVAAEFQKYPNDTRLSAHSFFGVFCFDKWFQYHFG